MAPNETDIIICPSCAGKIAEGEVCPECGWSGLPQEVYSLAPLEIGIVLKDRYEVIKRISAGEVNGYLMMDKEAQCPVIVKEVAIPMEEENPSHTPFDKGVNKGGFEEELESHTETDSILSICSQASEDGFTGVNHAGGEIIDEVEENSGIWFEEDAAEDATEEQPTPNPSRGRISELRNCFFNSEFRIPNSEFPLGSLPENEASTSELDSGICCRVADQQNLITTQRLPFERLHAERAILEELGYPTIVKVLDYFEDDGRAYLVEQYFEGCKLQEAWHFSNCKTKPPVGKVNILTQQIDWLIQLCQGLAKVHAASVLYNAITPDRLSVSKENRLVLTDFSSAVKLPLEKKHQQGIDFYVAPELILNPETVDVRADLYSLGVMWYQLLLGRPLTEEDFECQFILKPLQDYVPHLHPVINQLLLKLTGHKPDLRFASTDEVKSGKQPVVSLQRKLLQLKQSLGESTLIIGSQTNAGLQRATNEDNLWAQNLSYRSLDGHVPLGLFIVADGMGGAEAGEVASKIVIQTISDALLPQLIALRDRVDEDHSEDLLEKIKDAIIIANKEIIAQTEQIPFFPPFPKGGRGDFSGMGSTVTLAAVVGMRAYIGHVGDSRLYLINKPNFSFTKKSLIKRNTEEFILNKEGIHQKTTDHSIVSRLLQIGAITPEEAETHPQRDVLLKAVGARPDIEPDTFSFTIEQGDILLLCSDGLTKHLQDSEIHQIVMRAEAPQQACDSFVNNANLCGGEDNITVIIVQLVPCQFSKLFHAPSSIG
ncbi:hypothetical protein FJZ31_24230 [Candidatus Poribacteria bacterium]|nr:hypothetical protein [Candidatus Poribacteria bacterium]